METKENTYYDMFAFLKTRGQKANIPALKNYVNQLCGLAAAKSFKGALQGQLDSIELIKWAIICEACALVLSGELDKLETGGNDAEE